VNRLHAAVTQSTQAWRKLDSRSMPEYHQL
jgi:hypothetical protein